MSAHGLRTPWSVTRGNSYRYEVQDSSGFTVARIVGGILDGGKVKADLIAAAPAMAQLLDTTRLNLITLRNASPGVRTYDAWLAEVEKVLRQAGVLPADERKCGECLMDRTEVVALVNGVCPKCRTAYIEPAVSR